MNLSKTEIIGSQEEVSITAGGRNIYLGLVAESDPGKDLARSLLQDHQPTTWMCHRHCQDPIHSLLPLVPQASAERDNLVPGSTMEVPISSGDYENIVPDLRLELMVQLMGDCSELDTGKAIVYYGLCIDMVP